MIFWAKAGMWASSFSGWLRRNQRALRVKWESIEKRPYSRPFGPKRYTTRPISWANQSGSFTALS